MACFIAPAAEAIVTTIVTKTAQAHEKKEKEAESLRVNMCEEDTISIPFSRKLKWLSNLLWGGSALLAFEHIWHGEVVPYFPFLTAASNAADAAEMLKEIATTGMTMAAIVTAVWVGMLGVVHMAEKAERAESAAKKEEKVFSVKL